MLGLASSSFPPWLLVERVLLLLPVIMHDSPSLILRFCAGEGALRHAQARDHDGGELERCALQAGVAVRARDMLVALVQQQVLQQRQGASHGGVQPQVRGVGPGLARLHQLQQVRGGPQLLLERVEHGHEQVRLVLHAGAAHVGGLQHGRRGALQERLCAEQGEEEHLFAQDAGVCEPDDGVDGIEHVARALRLSTALLYALYDCALLLTNTKPASKEVHTPRRRAVRGST